MERKDQLLGIRRDVATYPDHRFSLVMILRKKRSCWKKQRRLVRGCHSNEKRQIIFISLQIFWCESWQDFAATGGNYRYRK